MDDRQKRAALLAVYPKSDTWAHKLRFMNSEQLTAIYMKFRREGKIK